MYPHERSLVKRLKDKPFALVGINSDSDREKILAIMEKEEITWRSFWNGGGTEGGIAKKWNVHGWPTIYVLDHKGVIRFKNKREGELDKAVDTLLEEMGVETRKSGE
jgi:hypothetical protein